MQPRSKCFSYGAGNWAQDPVTGDMVYAWSDCRTGDRDIYAQKIGLSGVPLWGDGGKRIVQAISHQEDPEVIYAGDGNWIFAWVDWRLTPEAMPGEAGRLGDIFAQKVNSNGDPLWSPDGVAACTSDDGQYQIQLVSDGVGGVIIFWRDEGSGGICAQHLTSTGEIAPGWLLNGLLISGSYWGDVPAADTDGNGGAIVTWQFNSNIYAQRVSPEGSLLWNPSGVPICTYSGEQSNPQLCADGQGGAYIVWRDDRFNPYIGDLFFQRVNSDGNPYYEIDGRSLCDASREQSNCRVVAADDGGAIFCWTDCRNDPWGYIEDIYAQKVNASGITFWGANGAVVCNADGSQSNPEMISDGNGGVIIGWADDRITGDNDYDIYVQRISSAGTPLWAINGVVVCDADNQQNYVTLKSDSEHGAYFFWSDTRTGSTGLYEQHLNSSGVPQLQPNGVLIHYGIDNNADNPLMVQTIPGQVLVAWEDFRNGQSTCLFIQLLDTSGNYFLEQDGRSVGIESVSGHMDAPQLASDLANGGLLVWEESRWPFNQIYVQRIDPNGNSLWETGGVCVYWIETGQQNPYVAGDGTGGAFVIWSGCTFSGNLHVYAQRLNASGIQVWSQPVELSHGVDTDDECFGAVPDGDGGVIMTWQAGPWPDFYVLAQKLDLNGNEVWQSGGIRVSNTNSGQWQPTVIADGTGSAVFAWRERRNPPYYDLYAQRVNASGSLMWSDSGLSVCSVPSDKDEAKLALDCDGNVFVLWQDFRNLTDEDIYLQKISPTGSLLFPSSGLPICVLEGDQLYPEMVSDNADGVYVVWQDSRPNSHSDIYCLHINGQGQPASPAWQQNGNVVCNALFYQLNPTIAPDGDGGCIIAWEDARASTIQIDCSLFAQRMNDGTTSIVREGITSVPREFRLEQNYPNPFNPATRIGYSLTHAGHVELTVYDILGRRVCALQNQLMAAGSHGVIWNGDTPSGDPVASGVYFYKLETNHHSEIRKMVLLK
jgi:hypothetical protein